MKIVLRFKIHDTRSTVMSSKGSFAVSRSGSKVGSSYGSKVGSADTSKESTPRRSSKISTPLPSCNVIPNSQEVGEHSEDMINVMIDDGWHLLFNVERFHENMLLSYNFTAI